MEIQKFALEGLLLFSPQVFGDDRGTFHETFREDMMRAAGVDVPFVQDNESCSRKGVLRGLHFQQGVHAQGKLVRVLRGAVRDVAVDIRPTSPTFGQHVVVELSEENHHIFYVPPGFAHGFVALEEDTIFSYKCTAYYNKESEGSLRYDDPDLNIDWGVEQLLLSPKDLEAPSWQEWKAGILSS